MARRVKIKQVPDVIKVDVVDLVHRLGYQWLIGYLRAVAATAGDKSDLPTPFNTDPKNEKFYRNLFDQIRSSKPRKNGTVRVPHT